MADMEIKINRNPVQVNNNITRPAPAQTKEIEKPAPQRPETDIARTKPREDIEETLDNIVSVSKDGDTVQVTEEGTERLEEDAFGKMAVKNEDNGTTQDDAAAGTDTARTGRVEITTEAVSATVDNRAQENAAQADKAQENTAQENTVSPTRERLEETADPTKPDPAKERLEAQRESDERRKEIIKDMVKSNEDDARADERAKTRETQEQVQQNITTLTGYTDQQLQQMVREGQISQNDYNNEMDARSEKIQASKDNNNEFAREMAINIAEEELTRRQAAEIQAVYAETSASVPDAETRADILDRLQNFTLN
ncbi:MAG: hypothetical protein IK139_07765 [Lachnospiraceae bacterium]|nr:hypothetical protein [Lachnospiraceae bacterium]